MGTIFDNKKSIFKKSKPLMTDGCCEEPEPCCGSNTDLRGGYRILFNHAFLTTPQEIFDGNGINVFLANGTKWQFYLETTGPVDVDVISITVTPSTGIFVYPPFTAMFPGTYILIESDSGFTGGSFAVTVVTDSGTFNFSANITYF